MAEALSPQQMEQILQVFEAAETCLAKVEERQAQVVWGVQAISESGGGGAENDKLPLPPMGPGSTLPAGVACAKLAAAARMNETRLVAVSGRLSVCACVWGGGG